MYVELKLHPIKKTRECYVLRAGVMLQNRTIMEYRPNERLE